MSRRSLLSLALGVAVVTLAGCADTQLPTAPSTGAPAYGGAEAMPNVTAFPPVSGAVVFDRLSPSEVPGSSRYVLYDDGTFSLQYLRPDSGFFEYGGTYSRANAAIELDFKGSNLAGPWDAAGVLNGDSLTVDYNPVMNLADFEDGLYVRTAG